MRPNIDGAFILECTNTNVRDEYRAHTIRPLAPFALHEVFHKRNIPSTVINYTDFWHPVTLIEMFEKWVTRMSVKNPVIVCSTLFNNYMLSGDNTVTAFIKHVKKEYNIKLIIGGPINLIDYSLDSVIPDAVFQGRSLHLFERWLDGAEPLPDTLTTVNGVQKYHSKSNVVTEDPIVPELFDDYCLHKNDILNFETRLGCKFNCTFCNFEFRNAKKVNDASVAKLERFFRIANVRYGIDVFSCVDDTFNEDDNKIQTLHTATGMLDYKPCIVGYNRFDIMMAKPYQAELLDECGFHGHYFGIETLNREASKLIRKGIRKQRAYDFMRFMRDSFPHWHTCAGYIVGIPGEEPDEAIETMAYIAENKLLKSIIPNSLGLYRIPGNEHNYSEMSKNPEKFGIQLTKEKTGNDVFWTSATTDKRIADVAALRAASILGKKNCKPLDPWEWASGLTTGHGESAHNHIRRYISRKVDYITWL